jgi:predicted DNA-binding ribbon-helix-helix protein
MATKKATGLVVTVERVQTGVRLEKRLLKVLKGLAETLDLSLGDLIEGIALHALENKPPFSAATLRKAADLKRVYGLTLGAEDSHRLRDRG